MNKISLRQPAVACIGLSLALMAGCATQSTPEVVAGCQAWERQRAAGSNLPVNLLSPEIARFVGVAGITSSRTGTGMVRVEAQLVNCADVDVVVLVRTRFSGTGPAESPSAWCTVFLPPRAQVTYTESAISVQSSQFALDIHDANRGQSQFRPGQTYRVEPASARQP